jgi:hypothetical protein
MHYQQQVVRSIRAPYSSKLSCLCIAAFRELRSKLASIFSSHAIQPVSGFHSSNPWRNAEDTVCLSIWTGVYRAPGRINVWDFILEGGQYLVLGRWDCLVFVLPRHGGPLVSPAFWHLAIRPVLEKKDASGGA